LPTKTKLSKCRVGTATTFKLSMQSVLAYCRQRLMYMIPLSRNELRIIDRLR